jgi:enoyl-[acyl-carrier protein] reductase III
MADRFRGATVLVTGGSKGIGRATALRLAAEGAAVGLTWFRDRTSAEKTLAALAELGARSHGVKAHLGDHETPGRVVAEVREALGEPDLLVSNAATGVYRPLRDVEKQQWDWTMETNAAALLGLVRAAPGLRAAVALTSLGASRVKPGYGMVGVSKAALEAIMRYLAVELAPACRVNAISAGILDTRSLHRLFPESTGVLDEARRDTPAGRLVTPDDVASLAAFLLSEEAAMITGQTVTIDGGYSVLV